MHINNVYWKEKTKLEAHFLTKQPSPELIMALVGRFAPLSQPFLLKLNDTSEEQQNPFGFLNKFIEFLWIAEYV